MEKNLKTAALKAKAKAFQFGIPIEIYDRKENLLKKLGNQFGVEPIKLIQPSKEPNRLAKCLGNAANAVQQKIITPVKKTLGLEKCSLNTINITMQLLNHLACDIKGAARSEEYAYENINGKIFKRKLTFFQKLKNRLKSYDEKVVTTLSCRFSSTFASKVVDRFLRERLEDLGGCYLSMTYLLAELLATTGGTWAGHHGFRGAKGWVSSLIWKGEKVQG